MSNPIQIVKPSLSPMKLLKVVGIILFPTFVFCIAGMTIGKSCLDGHGYVKPREVHAKFVKKNGEAIPGVVIHRIPQEPCTGVSDHFQFSDAPSDSAGIMRFGVGARGISVNGCEYFWGLWRTTNGPNRFTFRFLKQEKEIASFSEEELFLLPASSHSPTDESLFSTLPNREYWEIENGVEVANLDVTVPDG